MSLMPIGSAEPKLADESILGKKRISKWDKNFKACTYVTRFHVSFFQISLGL